MKIPSEILPLQKKEFKFKVTHLYDNWQMNYDTVQSVVSHFLSSRQKIWSLISRCQKIIRSLYCPTSSYTNIHSICNSILVVKKRYVFMARLLIMTLNITKMSPRIHTLCCTMHKMKLSWTQNVLKSFMKDHSCSQKHEFAIFIKFTGSDNQFWNIILKTL